MFSRGTTQSVRYFGQTLATSDVGNVSANMNLYLAEIQITQYGPEILYNVDHHKDR